jgi:ssDNA-binding Zn-finger/Zn-ribbon topoisomerase 1
LIAISAKATYSIQDVKQAIAAYLPCGFPGETGIEPNHPSGGRDANVNDKLCPKCSSPMVRKTARKGKHIGNDFWACGAFPKCRHTEAIDV